jgi:hypothetical protein
MWSKANFAAKCRFANCFAVDMPVEMVEQFKGGSKVLC